MSNEEAKGRATIERFERDRERDKAKVEALKEQATKGLAAAIKKKGEKVAEEFIEARKVDPTGSKAIENMNEARKDLLINDTYWGNEVTGEEESCRRTDDEEDY